MGAGKLALTSLLAVIVTAKIPKDIAMKLSIAEATAAQLADFANRNYGLTVNYRQGRDFVLAELNKVGFSGSEIDVDGAEQAAETIIDREPARLAGGKAGFSGQTAVIRIPQQNEPGGKDPVVGGVNGLFFRIVRDTDVEVPIEYVRVLQNANRVEYSHGENGEPINPTEVPTHPFSILRMSA